MLEIDSGSVGGGVGGGGGIICGVVVGGCLHTRTINDEALKSKSTRVASEGGLRCATRIGVLELGCCTTRVICVGK